MSEPIGAPSMHGGPIPIKTVANADGTHTIGVSLFGSAIPAGNDSSGAIATKDAGMYQTCVWGVNGACVESADASAGVAVTNGPTAGQKIVIVDLVYSAESALSVIFEEETSGKDVYKWFGNANSGFQITLRAPIKLATADKRLMMKTSGAGNVACTCTYYYEP